MRKKWLFLLTAGLLGLSTMGAFASESESEEEGLKQDVIILATSDVHCGIDQGFGYAGLEAVRESYEEQGFKTILVDDGDSIQGEPVGTVTSGETIINLMNDMGYDLAIPGNHEFDYGMERFLELTEMADFPYISCNFNKNGELVFDPYWIKEIDGVRIAFVGATTPKTLSSSTPKYFQDEDGNYIYGFFQDETGEGLCNAIQTAVDEARGEGEADYVFLIAHLGNEAECIPFTYMDVISNTSGIDAVFDGHAHDTDQVVMKNKDGQDVMRLGVGIKLSGIGWLRISAEDGSITSGLHSWNNDVSAPELLGIRNKMYDRVKEVKDELSDQLEQVVAHTPVDLTINDPVATADDGSPIRIIRRAETNLGDLCADAYLDQSGADIAFVNGGGIRVTIEKGDITMGDILNVHPFGNEMCVIEVSGQQILDALEWGARVCPEQNGGFLQVAGLSYEIHTYIENSCTEDENGFFTGVDGEYRVKNVLVGGEKLDPEKTYTLASHNYMLKDKGDGFTMFEGCNILQDEVKLDYQVLKDYITGTLNGEIGEEYVEPYGQGRIVAVDEAPAETEAE